jgi:hypothetical protein
MELVRIPVWEAKYTVGHDPDELAHMVCCRDLDWQMAMCGYWDEMSRDLRPVHTALSEAAAKERGSAPRSPVQPEASVRASTAQGRASAVA